MTPQKENGYTAVANELMEALARCRLPGEQMQCLLVVFRKTYGWNKKEDAIANSQFCEATGMKKGNVSRAVKALATKKIVIKNDNSRIPTYQFNKNYSEWQVLSISQPVIKDATAVINMATAVIKTDNKLLSKVMDTKASKTTITKDTITKANKFVQPTLQEVSVYCQERGNNVNPEQWMDHYLANGWKVGRGGLAMKDWKAAVRTWETNNFGNRSKPKPFVPAGLENAK